MQQTNLTSHFLIAMPSLKDPNFEKSVTYICAHNEEGAMGIVINKPLDIDLGEIFEQMDIPTDNQDAKGNRRSSMAVQSIQTEDLFCTKQITSGIHQSSSRMKCV